MTKRLKDHSFSVVHLHCHGETAHHWMPPRLVLHDSSKYGEVRLPDLRASTIDRQQGRRPPIVFLNACGGAHMPAKGEDSFPLLLAEHGHASVVAVETTVGQGIADLFAQRFYEFMLKGHTVRAAMMKTREALWKETHNPQVYAYTLHGEGDELWSLRQGTKPGEQLGQITAAP